MALSAEERARYARHLALPEIAAAGQERLKSARVLVIGAGGLGSPSALYLAAAGVGTLGLVDCDRVDLSNLQRQVLFDNAALDRPKATAARDRLLALNPGIRVDRTRARASRGQRARSDRRVRRGARRHRSPPDALPRQRRLRAARQAARHRGDPSIRGTGDDLRAGSGSVLPVPLPRNAGRARAELRRGRRARRASRRARRDPGDRGHQARRGRGEPLVGRLSDLRCARAAIPGVPLRAPRRLRGLRRAADHHRAARRTGGVYDGCAAIPASNEAVRAAGAARGSRGAGDT